MAKYLHGCKLLISEHGIYTREREEELLKASWVAGIYKNIWIEQFKKYHRKNEFLLVLGRGEDKEKCDAILDDNIIHYGFTDNPYAFMKIADIYMSASLAEGFSIAVLEAMDNGLTLFLSDIPSHLEVFEANSDAGPYLGETFTSGDEKSFLASWDRLRGNYARIDKQRIISFKESEMSVNGMIMGYKELYQKKK